MGLEEHELREWVQRVTRGEASRRQFMRTMLGLGLAGPVRVQFHRPVGSRDPLAGRISP